MSTFKFPEPVNRSGYMAKGNYHVDGIKVDNELNLK